MNRLERFITENPEIVKEAVKKELIYHYGIDAKTNKLKPCKEISFCKDCKVDCAQCSGNLELEEYLAEIETCDDCANATDVCRAYNFDTICEHFKAK